MSHLDAAASQHAQQAAGESDELGAEPVAATEPETEDTQWRDAAEVGVEESRTAWAAAAREELLGTAQSYHTVLTHKELALAVQERTGIRTKQLAHSWIGDVLTRVARECASRDEPLLSSLSVNADGSVGSSYGAVVAELTGQAPSDPDDHAAAQRLECHRHFGAEDLPSHGGSKALTERLSAARTRSRRKHHAEKEANVCPTCQMALPATGVCDNCD